MLRRVFLLSSSFMTALSCSPPDPATPPAPSPPTVPSAPPSTSVPPPVSRAFDYPATRKETITEELHGIRVEDPYRWLEDEKSPEVRAWMDAQNTLTRTILDKLPEREAIAERLRELFYVDSLGIPYRFGKRYFYTRRHADREKAIVYWKEGKDGQEQVLLDPNSWSADGSMSLGGWSVSWDGSRVAYSVKKNNSDEATLEVIEVATGKKSEIDVIEGAKYAHARWTPQGDGFYYAYLPTDKSIPVADRPGYTEIRFHKLGEDPKKDKLIRERTGDPKAFLNTNLSKDGRYLFVYVQHGWNATDVFFRDLRDPKQKDTWTPLTVGKDAIFSVYPYKDQFYVHTNEGAPKYRVFRVDPNKPERAAWKEIVPEHPDATLENVSLVGGKLSLLYLKDVMSQIELRFLNGKLDRVIPLPAPGTATPLIGQPDQDEAYFVFTSLVHPSEIHEISVKKGDARLFFKAKVPMDPSKFTVEQRFATSKDGTRIPLFIVASKDTKRDGTAPTLLYGYGGFQVAMQPSFRSSIIPWLERGGVFAMAVLRGGSEYGEEWHRNGMLHKKQNVFDDFLASAEFLIAERYTRPGRLAIQGASNGGLLVGAAMTQRPDLFRVVLCGVPLLDMVRYHLFGSGKTWIEEYGSADNPEDFKVLYGYSPYHRVQPGVKYPALLMLSADSDDRVDPMHARKFIAQIQEHSTGGLALLRIEKNAGHGGADLLKAAVQKGADELAFALSQMEP
ncbi:MAG: prolyl oligopeptidase family serine peptidase [Myxococcales bacterium]|nr:prolyl oligopeptidase family serine peptidase [Myxococcales bacterium]